MFGLDGVGHEPCFDVGGVGFLEQDLFGIRGPPVALEAVHFFLGDEFGEAVGEAVGAAGGEAAFGGVGVRAGIFCEVDDVDIVIADVGDEFAVGRKAGIEDGAGAGFQFLDLGAGAVEDVEFAGKADKDARAIAGEFVIGETADADAHAFAAGFFFGREIFIGAFEELLGGEKEFGGFGRDVEFVEKQFRDAGFGAQEEDGAAVGRGLGARRASEHEATGEGVVAEVGGVGDLGVGHLGGEGG